MKLGSFAAAPGRSGRTLNGLLRLLLRNNR